MTGDRKHTTARSPFYRMNGHLRLGKSTENQIIQGFRKHLKIRDISEQQFCEMEITYYSYLLNSYVKDELKNHHIKRKFGEKVESFLIKKFQEWCKENKGNTLFNTGISNKGYKEVKEIGDQLFNDLRKRIKTN